MADNHQVTCHQPDDSAPHRRILGLGGPGGGGWYKDEDYLIAGIEAGLYKLWTVAPDGKSVWIVVASREGRNISRPSRTASLLTICWRSRAVTNTIGRERPLAPISRLARPGRCRQRVLDRLVKALLSARFVFWNWPICHEKYRPNSSPRAFWPCC